VQPIFQQGTFTPATLELDSVTFSTREGLNVDFSANQGGFELLEPDSATSTPAQFRPSATHVPE
jgi:hypothetical protein